MQLLNGSSLDDCGRLDDCLDKTSRILVFFLLKSRISHHEHSFPSLQPLAAYRTIAEQMLNKQTKMEILVKLAWIVLLALK